MNRHETSWARRKGADDGRTHFVYNVSEVIDG